MRYLAFQLYSAQHYLQFGIMAEYLQVSAVEGEECVELPTEEDKTVLLSTITAQFPDTCGLKFKTAAGRMRGIRITNGRLYPPSSDGWGDTIYYCVFANDASRLNSLTLSSFSSLSCQSIPERGRRMSEQSTSLFNCQSFLNRMKEKHESNSSVASSIVNSLLKREELSKNTMSSSCAEYDSKLKKISAMILELKKAYKEKLIYDFITKSQEELIFEKSDVLPKNIINRCESNILKANIGYFNNPIEKCNHELFQVLFGTSIENKMEQISVKNSKIFGEKLFQHVSFKAEEALESIAEVDELGFASFLKEGLVKPGSILSDEQLYIISQSAKIKSAHDKCMRTTTQILEILERLCNYRRNILPNLNEEIIDSLKTKAEVVEKETRCFFAEVEKKICDGDENIIEAIQILQKHLKEAFEKKTYDLMQLKMQRDEYEKVKGQRFNELVQEYKRLEQVLNTKTEMLEMYNTKDSSGNLSKSYIDSDSD